MCSHALFYLMLFYSIEILVQFEELEKTIRLMEPQRDESKVIFMIIIIIIMNEMSNRLHL